MSGCIPTGVHDFQHPEAEPFYATTPTDPVILHYTCCGFQHFWNKFTTLEQVYEQGREVWWGKEMTPLAGPFYLDAREVVSRGDKQAARDFYQRRYVIADEAIIDELMEQGLCCRILEPARLLTPTSA